MTNDLRWTRSSRCGSNACVEVAGTGPLVFLRDSKNPQQAPLAFTRETWQGWLDEIAADPDAWR